MEYSDRKIPSPQNRANKKDFKVFSNIEVISKYFQRIKGVRFP